MERSSRVHTAATKNIKRIGKETGETCCEHVKKKMLDSCPATILKDIESEQVQQTFEYDCV